MGTKIRLVVYFSTGIYTATLLFANKTLLFSAGFKLNDRF